MQLNIIFCFLFSIINNSNIIFHVKRYTKFSVWWNTKTAFGYVMALLPQTGCAISYMVTLAVTVLFYRDVCSYVEACVDDSATIILEINTNFHGKSDQNLQTLKIYIIDVIKLHQDILWWAEFIAF